MKRIREIVLVLGLLGTVSAGLWFAFEEYQGLVKKEELEARERVLRLTLLELAKCVDNPQYLGASQRAERDPTCETRVFRALDELEAR